MSRDLFSELKEGMESLELHNKGKITLKTHKVAAKSIEALKPDEIRSIREKLNISQAVLANYLRAAITTYQKWEQGKAKPNPQAVLLLRLVEKDPNTLKALESLL
ncbi:helix-turn-helix domain-containing protein [Xenorhabdus sp. Reich]|uniref:Helix-turn-helix domain-containing protein n=1 Tax=Xenorhabdus littoralis TaxID=2582835 RepID=A0ABU4SJ46_9GAMM|nr:type II toxin-antitoxin system MqsA family antitoxin [Xenorhabdus sp. Reich]MDX7998677.1 helix-turn-helix domain-containing protein [Xenorhabdus sp. Reich]